jgi:dUTP pyrophosphatase
MLNLLVKRLASNAILPVKGSPEAACFDLHVSSFYFDEHGYDVRTGLAVAMPPGYGMLVYPRSGLSTKFGLTLRNGTGVIDSDYRGEIILKFNGGFNGYTEEVKKALEPGARIAQAMIIQVPHVVLTEVTELPDSIRGGGGFGSTGV